MNLRNLAATLAAALLSFPALAQPDVEAHPTVMGAAGQPTCDAGRDGTFINLNDAGDWTDADNTGGGTTVAVAVCVDGTWLAILYAQTGGILEHAVLDGGDSGATTSRVADAPTLQIVSHNTACDSLTGFKRGEFCWQESDDTLWQCEPTSGDCDTAAEWRQATSSGGGGWRESFPREGPGNGDSFLWFEAEAALTVTRVSCICEAATSAVMTPRECDSAGDNCTDIEAALTCDVDGNVISSGIDNGSLDAGDWMRIDVGTVTGSPEHCTMTLSGT